MTHSVIIGGTRGLGRVAAKLMAERGDVVSIIGRREPVDEDKKIEGINHYICDILDDTQIKETLKNIVKNSGEVNYLVFCQRYRGDGDPWQGEIDATMNATKTIVELLGDNFNTDNDCAIVMCSSVFADYIGEGQPISYHVGKAAMNHMARYYAVEYGRKNIRCNILTAFTFLKEESKKFYIENKELMSLYEKIVPIGRLGTTEDNANLVEFLCSKKSAFINGQNIYVDGGLSLMWPENIARSIEGI